MDSRIAVCTLAACLCAAGGAAQADIVKCEDKDGSITLTDKPCQNGTVVVATDAAGTPVTGDGAVQYYESGPEVRIVDGVTRVTLPPDQFGPRSNREAYSRMQRPTPGQALSTDAATLRAARTMLSVTDPVPHRTLATR